METEKLDKVKEVDLLQETMDGMKVVVAVDVRLNTSEILKVGVVAGGVALLGTIAYSEVRGWLQRRKYEKQLNKALDLT